MSIKAVIFDIGGVIVRTEDQSSRRRLEEKFGLTEGSLHDLVFESEVAIQATEGAVPESRVWEYVAQALRLDPTELVALQQDFWAGDIADARLVGFIEGLRPRYKTALLSNAWSEARQILNEKYGLENRVDLMVVSAEELLAKPDSRIYKLTTDRLEIEPTEAVFVDDRLENIEAARTFGMHAIHFRTTAQLLDELAALGVTADYDRAQNS